MPGLGVPVINEVQSSNTSLPDPFGQLIDWVEIHNPTATEINLQGYYLSDSSSDRLKFKFPSATIAAGGYLTVWCGSGTDFATIGPYSDGQLRVTSFAISSTGEPIVLTAPDGTTVVDEFPNLAIGTTGTPPVGRSLGRGIGPNFRVLYFYNTPTRAAANTTAGAEALPLDPPAFSLAGGIYSDGQSVNLSTTVTNGVIHYTLDGSEPTEASPIFAGPLNLGAGGNPATGYSWIPTNPGGDSGFPFYDNWQAPQGSVARIHVLRARVFRSDGAASRSVTRSFVIDPAGTNRHAFPIVSIASDPAHLFDDRTGIYVHGTNAYATDWPNTAGAVPAGFWANYFQGGSTWERSSHLEFYERDGTQRLEGTIGLRINGNTTRNRPRKALRIYNRNTSGSTTWTNTALFPDRDVLAWDTFLLRAGGNDWNQSLFRDALVSAIAAPTGLDRQAARPVVLFLNGEYWGLHNLRERIDEHWIFHRYGLSESQFTLLEVVSGQPNFLNPTADFSWPIYDKGDPAFLADYKDILIRAGNDEFAGEGGYDALNARVDLENFIDYSAITIWSGNTDWPGNNVLLWRATSNLGGSPSTDGRWRYIIKDNDFSLGLNLPYVPGHDDNVTTMAQHDTLAYASSPVETTWANNEIGTRLLRKALENSEFRTKFINRFADLLNTSLATATTTAKLDEQIAAYQPGIAEHSARWPTPLNWTNEVQRIRGYLQARPGALRGHISAKFGLPGTANLTVDVSETSRGSVTVNTLTIDPSTVGVPTNPYPWTGAYFQNVPVTVSAVPKPGYRFVSWSNIVVPAGVVLAYDGASNYSSWTNGSRGGTGFGPWSLNRSTENVNQAGVFLDNPRGGWGLYANQSESTWVYRSLNDALQVGQRLALRVRHGSVDTPGEVGFELANTNGEPLFKIARHWWSDTYLINGELTEIPVSASPMDIEVSLVASNSYSARITPVGGATYTHAGLLFARTDRSVQRFLAYNYSAGNGQSADVFITSMQVTAPGPDSGTNYALYSTNPSITPTLTGNVAFLATFSVEPAMHLAISPPAVGAAGTPLGPIEVRAVNSIGDADGNYQGLVTLIISGPAGFDQAYQTNAVNGIASFLGLKVPTSGAYSLNAISGSLTATSIALLAVNASAVFLPPNNAAWHADTHWDTGTIPNGNSADVTIPGNSAGNRDVTNNAPTTVASIRFNNGSSSFRNRINGIAGQPLTLASTSGVASITVTGSGTGHGNIDVIGGVVLSNDLVLDVQNFAAGNTEYGALRLQGNWSGAGKIIKRGPGVAGITGTGKTFSGDVVVEEGVLTFSEPAISGNSVTNYTVQSGGQLRLSSAGNPRTYLFKGTLRLAGSGRNGVGTDENLGVLGALRLETGSTGTVAVLTNRVELTASADVHVPATNNITLQGPLLGSNVLTKSGGGTLQLDPGAGTFAGSIQVSRGSLHLGGVQFSNLVSLSLTLGATLSGNGTVSGGLTLQAGAILESSQGVSPDIAPLAVGGFVATGPAIFNLKFSGIPVAGLYPILTSASSISGLDQISLLGVPAEFAATRLVQEGGTVSVLLAENAFQAWLVENGLPADGTGPGSWLGDPDGDGWSNGEEFAFGLDPGSGGGQLLRRGGLDPNGTRFKFWKRTGSALTYEILSSTNLPNWETNAISSAPTAPQPAELPEGYEEHQVVLPADPGRGFLRIRAKP